MLTNVNYRRHILTSMERYKSKDFTVRWEKDGSPGVIQLFWCLQFFVVFSVHQISL